MPPLLINENLRPQAHPGGNQHLRRAGLFARVAERKPETWECILSRALLCPASWEAQGVSLKPEGVREGVWVESGLDWRSRAGELEHQPALTPAASTHCEELPNWATSSCEICNRLINLPPRLILIQRHKTDIFTLGLHHRNRL